jgi:two-component system sensor histidine kinase/response regulator
MSTADKVNILVVDDQPAKLMAHEAILDELNENIIKVDSGIKALEFLLKNECAVIVLDVNMPGMDGFETAALIRQRPSLERTPIIFVSAYSVSDLDRLKGYGIGGVDYLFIPIIPEVLKAKLQIFVEIFRQKQIIRKQANHLAEQNREMEEQIRTIRELNDKLKAANEELETFSFSVSHDLRGPLRAMRGYSDVLLADFKQQLPEEGVDYLFRISKAANRMDGLIRDVLAYSRVAKGELILQPVDLESLVKAVVETSDVLRPPQARVVLQSPLESVVAHEACLTQCLSNLLVNAVKFVPKTKKPEVRVRTERRGSVVRIWVEDNGIGIAPAHYDRIFEMFGRVHGAAEYEGNGIGLTIVKRGVKRMGGNVGVESELEKGSKFWIELPRALDSEAG